MADIEGKGAVLVAISADGTDGAAKLRADNNLTFPVWHDAKLAMTSAYGVQEEGKESPRPAIFIVGPDGRVTFAKIGENPADRPTTETILAALDA